LKYIQSPFEKSGGLFLYLLVMKWIVCAVLILALTNLYGQAPYPKFDLGKLKKDYVESSSDTGPFKKTPANHMYRSASLNGDFAKRIKGESFARQEKAKTAQNLIHYSRTFLGDTTSISNSAEYIENLNWDMSDDVLSIYLTDIVTNSDWQIFRAYVRDSIARRILAEEFPEEYLIPTYEIRKGDKVEKDQQEWNLRWEEKLHYTSDYYSPLLRQMYYSPHEEYYKRLKFDERKIWYSYSWTDDEFTSSGPLLSKQFPQNCYRNYEFYEKLNQERVALLRDSMSWIIDTTLNHFGNVEDGLVTYYSNHEYFKNKPVVGLNASQARAYLNWLQAQHQKLLDAKGVGLKVRYKLPRKAASDKLEEVIEIQSFNLESWRISNAEYEEFVNYVRDSIARRILAEEFPDRYLIPTYDSDLEERDQSEWDLNWKHPIDWASKTGTFTNDYKKKYPKVVKYPILESMFLPSFEGDTNQIDYRKIVFEHYIKDHKTSALEGKRIVSNAMEYTNQELRGREPLFVHFEETFKTDENKRDIRQVVRGDCYGQFGKDLSLSYLNSKGNSTDVYSHEDRSRFILQEKILVYPTINYKWGKLCLKGPNCEGYFDITEENQCEVIDCEECGEHFGMFDSVTKLYDFKSNPDAQIKVITFSQFKAYWWWKMRKGEYPKEYDNPVIQNYMPSKDEFLQIQTGVKVMHLAETLQLPTSGFRCEILYYAK